MNNEFAMHSSISVNNITGPSKRSAIFEAEIVAKRSVIGPGKVVIIGGVLVVRVVE